MCSELHYYNLTIQKWKVLSPQIRIYYSKRCFSMQETSKIYANISQLPLLYP